MLHQQTAANGAKSGSVFHNATAMPRSPAHHIGPTNPISSTVQSTGADISSNPQSGARSHHIGPGRTALATNPISPTVQSTGADISSNPQSGARSHHIGPGRTALATNPISPTVQSTGADISSNPQSGAQSHHIGPGRTALATNLISPTGQSTGGDISSNPQSCARAFIFENNSNTCVASWFQLPSSLYDKYYMYYTSKYNNKEAFNQSVSLSRFLIDIHDEEKQRFIDNLRESRFISMMIYGATNTSNSKDEIIYVTYCNHKLGRIHHDGYAGQLKNLVKESCPPN